jgi:DNA replication protein DnaC
MGRGATASLPRVVPDTADFETQCAGDTRANTGGPARTGSARHACDLCFGTGMEVVRGKGARMCPCRETDLRRKLFEGASIPARYEACSFASYQPAKNYASQTRAFDKAYGLVREYPSVERGLLLAGPVGVGKTHLAVAVLRGLIGKGAHCLFRDFGSLLKEIQDSFHTDSHVSEEVVLAPIYGAEVLVLDELGASRPTDWVLETMSHVIGKRYNDKKLTVFTTNYLDEPRNASEQTLQDRIGVRLRSRLYEMCRTILIEGEDYRRRTYDRPEPRDDLTPHRPR